jgi:hypothetical protein
MKEDEMGGACGIYGGEEKYIQEFLCGYRKERDHLEDLDIDGIILLTWILKE